ncbi:MAG: hypothetical protein ACUVX8_13465 [Candidatus Zipacnadales bacterium]
MNDEMHEVRELTLTKLDGHEAKLTLTDNALIVETSEDSPLPEWLRGEIPFDDLDIAYVDLAKERAWARAEAKAKAKTGAEAQTQPSTERATGAKLEGEASVNGELAPHETVLKSSSEPETPVLDEEEGEYEEEDEEIPAPGFRIARWIELKAKDSEKTFPRRAAFVMDEGHVDLAQAEAFAVTFCRLAGRPLPWERKKKPTLPDALAETPVAETPLPSAVELTPTKRPAEALSTEVPAFTGSDAFSAADSENDTPAFASSEAFAPPDDEKT